MSSVLIVCIGNDLVADDGVGQKIYESLQKKDLPISCRLVLLGLGGIDLIEQMDGEDQLIVIDAVQFGSKVGTIHKLNWLNLPSMDHRPVSGHGIGVREALDVCAKLYPEKLPKMCWLVGIEGECFDQLGTGLTATVADAIPEALDIIMDITIKGS